MLRIRQWFANARSVSLVQSVMPALMATAMAWTNPGFRWWTALLAVVGVAMAHLAMNLADDWFDYRADMLSDRDRVIRRGFRAMTHKYPYLTDGSETLKTTAYAIAQFIAIALACGVAIFVRRTADAGFAGPFGSWWIPATVAVCGFMGVFYSAPPLKLAYRGLGELVIGMIFGPLLMTGVYYSACGSVDWGIILTGIPVGLLVTNILFTHSFIEMKGDEASNKMTFARLLGKRKACLAASLLLIFLPFALTVLAVCLGFLHPAYLAVIAVTPRGIWLFRSLVQFMRDEHADVGTPAKWLGPMPDWKAVRERGTDWFLIRWMTARNLLSGFCVIFSLVAIILKIAQ